MIRVLLVDRQTEVRKGLRMCLAIEPDIAVVGETGKIEEAHALAQALGPAVIMVDVGRQGMTSLNIIQRLREASPKSAIVVLTLCSDEDMRTRARDAGAQTFLEKRGRAADLLEIIR